MEYVRQRGAFDDMPLAEIAADILRTYPVAGRKEEQERDFLADVARETGT